MADSIWKDALERKKKQLDDAKIDLVLDVTSLTHFEASLDRMQWEYSEKKTSILLKDKLSPTLEHITSFSEAISAATEAVPYSGLVWGGLLVVFKSICRVPRCLDDILTEIEELHSSLPQFSEYIDIYNTDPGLQLCLRDLLEDYLDFCICVVKYTSKSPAVHMFRNIVSSSPIKGIREVKSSIEKHKRRFIERAEAAHRRNAELHYFETLKLKQTVSSGYSSLQSSISPASNAALLRTISPSSQETSAAPTRNTRLQTSTDPFIHTVSWKRNTTFAGRDRDLELLHQYIGDCSGLSEPKSCAVHGIGGVGKTQLALEYTYRYRASFQAIFWLRTENTVELMKSFSSIGDKLGIIDDVNGGRRTSRILDWLETTEKRWLLVMDNLEEIDTVASIWPTTSISGGSIIVTTQKPCDSLKWADFDLPLYPLSGSSGSELLLTQVPTYLHDENVEELQELAMEMSNAVGGLPLWLNALGGFIAQSQCTLAECMELYKASSAPLDLGIKAGNWAYERSPSTVFDLAFSRLSDDAKTMLYILAFLNPDGVPENILSVESPSADIAVLDQSNRQRFFNAIANLRTSQLVKREGHGNEPFLTTHRSIQTAVLRKLNVDLKQRQQSFGQTITILRRVFPHPSPLQQPESDKWPLIEAYLPQLLSLESAFHRARPSIEGSMELAILLSDVGLNVWDRGIAEGAKSLMLTAEKVLDSIDCDPWAMERSDIRVILGILTDSRGITQRVEGLQYRESAHQIRKRYIDSIPPDQLTLEEEIRYYNTVTDLACSQQQFNLYNKIEETCNLVLQKYKSWGTEDQFPYEFAKYYHHMAYVLISRGETNKAVQYASHATKLLEQGSFGLLATVFKFDCATLYFQNAQPDLAISEHEQVLRHREDKLGRSNILTIQTRLVLGVIYYFTNQIENAEVYIREVLLQCDKRHLLREVHIRAKFYMSLVLRYHGYKENIDEARQLAEEARLGLKELLPQDLPTFLQGKGDDDPIMYDYLAPWTYRVVVERR